MIDDPISLPLLPLVRQPSVPVADGSGGQVDQQLGEVKPRVDRVPCNVPQHQNYVQNRDPQDGLRTALTLYQPWAESSQGYCSRQSVGPC